MLKRQMAPDGLQEVVTRPPVFFSGRRFILMMALFHLVAFLFSSPTSAQTDLIVLRSDDTGFTFDFVPTPVQHDTVRSGGERYDVIAIDQCVLTTIPGSPQIPQRRVLVALPPGAVPSILLLAAPFREEAGYRLAPAPRLSTDGLVYFPDHAVYSATGMTPDRPLTAEAAAELNGYTLLPLTLSPIAYSPATGRVRFYDRIRVEVRFNAPPTAFFNPQSSVPRVIGSVFEGTVLNAAVARSWRRSNGTVRSATRTTAFGPGEWYKIIVSETGLYQIDRQTLQNAGVNLNTLDPKTIRMFSGGGRTLPQDVDAPRPELRELAIGVTGEGDGRFDGNDTIRFYGTATEGWDYLQASRTYSHFKNPYTDQMVYWLSVNGTTPGRRIGTRSLTGGASSSQTDTPVRRHEERELINPLESGVEWFWQLFDGSFREEATFQVSIGSVARNGQVTAQFNFQSKTSFTHNVQVFLNDQFVGGRVWNGASVSISLFGAGAWLKDGVNEIRIVLPRTGGQASLPDHLYLDWFELACTAPLDASSGELAFEQEIQNGGSITRYAISGAPADAQVYDVTDLFNVTQMTRDLDGAVRDSVRTVPTRYRLSTPTRWKRPVSVTRDRDSDLRNLNNGADYLLITADEFTDAAEKLRVHRMNSSNLRVLVAQISDIYDEFSWGLVDPTAIRDFLRHAALNWTNGASPGYAVLLGDGNYDYKNHSRLSRGNWIPPFEAGERCTDDYFVYFDGNGDPIIENDIFPDMAIGRLPAQSPRQADVLVSKIIAYEANPEYGTWRNTIVLVADDERTPGSDFDEPYHLTDTERLANQWIPATFRVEKVYLTEYPLDASGEKPGAKEQLIQGINDGALLVNWVGHGAANLWAHERVFNTGRDLSSLENGVRLPVFVTATCTAGRFDLLTEEAMAEEFVRAEGKGAVGFIGATRLSFPSPNAALNRGLYQALLTYRLTLGEALLQAKIGTVNRENSERYTLFGDPAMRIGAPQREVQFINAIDTLRVLQTATVGATVLNGGAVDAVFSGTAQIYASDSAQKVTYVTARGGQMLYQLPGSDLFRGSVPITQGQLSASFIVPRDVTYGGNQGRISVYVTNGQTDGSGVLVPLPLRGAVPSFQDSTGPQIEILVDGRPVTIDDYTSRTPELTLRLFDESGINLTGEVGHQIIIQTDHDANSRRDVTARFVYDSGSYQRGSLKTRLPALTPGEHPISVKAWDNFNNSSSLSLSLSVVEETDLRVTNVMNYPNPFNGPTTFTFELTQDADITLQVYTVSGVLIRSFSAISGLRGFNQLEWDGLDRDGDQLANGAYLYKITARTQTQERQTLSVFGRLLVIR